MKARNSVSKPRINIALVCTSGGHFEQMTNLSDFYNSYNHFWITNRNRQTEALELQERVYYIQAAHFKEPWKYLAQVPSLLEVFKREKPTHALSTGSGRTAFVPYLLSRLFGAEFIHIDTYSRVSGYSKFGAFLIKIGDRIYTQWETSNNGKTIYIGPVFKTPALLKKKPNSSYVFVTLGTREESFERLLKGIEELAEKSVIKERIIVQAGHTKFRSDRMELFDFRGYAEIEELILNAKYVITQESAGVGTQCLKARTRFIVMPRDYQYGELPAKSDMREDLHLKLEEMGYTRVVKNTAELEAAIQNLEHLKVGFNFDNTLAIQTLKKIIEPGTASQ